MARFFYGYFVQRKILKSRFIVTINRKYIKLWLVIFLTHYIVYKS